MSPSEAKKLIEELSAELKQHTYNYYVLAMPTITDFEFDKKLEQLTTLEKQFPELQDPDSPTQKVGGFITKEFTTVKHRWPMLSLGNTYNAQELLDFDQRIRKAIGDNFEYVCELKFDGLSMSLTYEHGKLVRAVHAEMAPRAMMSLPTCVPYIPYLNAYMVAVTLTSLRSAAKCLCTLKPLNA